MKDEFEKNLTEQPEADDLGIKATMEGIEPEEGARERMLQNIMKKAEVLRAAETGEASKAEILSLGAAKKAAGAEKQAEKAKKNRWKLYVPMLATAAVILTIGTIFFVKLGMEKSSSDEMKPADQEVAAHVTGAPSEQDAAAHGIDAPKDQYDPTSAGAETKVSPNHHSSNAEKPDVAESMENGEKTPIVSDATGAPDTPPEESQNQENAVQPENHYITEADAPRDEGNLSHQTRPVETYKVTILDPEDLITDKPEEAYFAPGTLLTLHSGVICDADLVMYVNGEYYSHQSDMVNEDGDFIGWEYTFEMIPEDVVIEFRTEGGE